MLIKSLVLYYRWNFPGPIESFKRKCPKGRLRQRNKNRGKRKIKKKTKFTNRIENLMIFDIIFITLTFNTYFFSITLNFLTILMIIMQKKKLYENKSLTKLNSTTGLTIIEIVIEFFTYPWIISHCLVDVLSLIG